MISENRPYHVFGNLKGNMGTQEEADPWLSKMDSLLKENKLNPFKVRLVVFAPYAMLYYLNDKISQLSGLSKARSDGLLHTGVQTVSPYGSGDFTGLELADSARAFEATYSLHGHSEQRHKWPYTKNPIIKKQILRAQDAGLTSVLCVGETRGQHDAGLTDEVLIKQLDVLRGISQWKGGVVYEPVWAIGGTKPPPPASDIVKIRSRIAEIANELGEQLDFNGYGGSVNDKNAKEIAPTVNALLPGTASRFPEKWYAIAMEAQSLKS